MHARIYDFTLIAGGMQRLPVVGDFFKVISATGTINVNVDTGATLDLMPGQGLREFNFNTLTITDKSGAANVGKILVGFSGMVDDRVTGEVSIIDGSIARSRSQAAFWVSTGVSALAGNYSHVQLWNPAASAKNLIVTDVACDAMGAAGAVAMCFSTAAISTVLASAMKSKLFGAPSSSVAELRGENNVGLLGTSFNGMQVGVDSKIVNVKEPLIIPPGNGLIVRGAVVNQSIRGNFQFFEEPV